MSYTEAAVAVGVPGVLYAIAKVLELRNRETYQGGRRLFTPLFWAALGVVHLGVDYNWAYVHLRLLASSSSSHPTVVWAGVLLFALACAGTLVGNAVTLVLVVRDLSKSGEKRRRLLQLYGDGRGRSGTTQAPDEATFDEWRALNRSMFWFVCLACCFKLSILNVVYCRAFRTPIMCAPVRTLTSDGREHADARMVKRRVGIMVVVEDLPQLVAVAAVAVVNGSESAVANAAALAMSALGLLHELLVVCDLVFGTTTTRPASQHTNGLGKPLLGPHGCRPSRPRSSHVVESSRGAPVPVQSSSPDGHVGSDGAAPGFAYRCGYVGALVLLC